MTDSISFLNGDVLSLTEVRIKIYENIILQKRNSLGETLIDNLFPGLTYMFGNESVFYIPEYRLKVSALDDHRGVINVDVVDEPKDGWKIAHINSPIVSSYPFAIFKAFDGMLYLCFYRNYQVIKEDLSVESGYSLESAISIDIVNRCFSCGKNYTGTAPVDLLDAYAKMGNNAHFIPNGTKIHNAILIESEKNKAFEDACQASDIFCTLEKTDIIEILFLLNAYMVNPDAVTHLSGHNYAYRILMGFIKTRSRSLFGPGEIMSSFKQLFNHGDTAEEVLGITIDELEYLEEHRGRTREDNFCDWIVFVKKKQGVKFGNKQAKSADIAAT